MSFSLGSHSAVLSAFAQRTTAPWLQIDWTKGTNPMFNCGLSKCLNNIQQLSLCDLRLQLHFYDENPYTEDVSPKSSVLATGRSFRCRCALPQDVSLGSLSLPVSELPNAEAVI